MGAYGHRGLRERLFGSDKQRLLSKSAGARCSSTIEPVDLWIDRTQLCETIHAKNVTSTQWRIYPGADAHLVYGSSCLPAAGYRSGALQPTARCRWAVRGREGQQPCATPGAVCLSNSTHLPLMPYSNTVNPVALPPGRARLATRRRPDQRPARIQSARCALLEVMVLISAVVPLARMTSGVSATSSSASRRMSSASLPPER